MIQENVLTFCSFREDAFAKKLWEKTSTHVFENIYLPASQADNAGYVYLVMFSSFVYYYSKMSIKGKGVPERNGKQQRAHSLSSVNKGHCYCVLCYLPR